MGKGVSQKGPLLDLRTPLSLIPKAWLNYVEPKIIRPAGTVCWLWDGALDNAGEPVVAVKRGDGRTSTVRVKRLVAELYWHMKPHYNVVHECGNLNCLAPFHFYISELHYAQENRKRRIARKRNSIKAWEKQLAAREAERNRKKAEAEERSNSLGDK